VLVTPADVTENLPFLDLLWRARFRWHLHPDQVTGDATYGTVASIVAIEDQAVRAYVPLSDVGKRPGFFGPEAFIYDAEHDVYTCLNGTMLRFRGNHYGARVRAYQAPANACNVCPIKEQCTDSQRGRIFTRSFDEPYLDRVRAYHETAAYRKAMRKRSVWVEPLFGERKDWHGLSRFWLRGLWKVNAEALLIATGQNLKRLLQKRARRVRTRRHPRADPGRPRRSTGSWPSWRPTEGCRVERREEGCPGPAVVQGQDYLDRRNLPDAQGVAGDALSIRPAA
jgi:hypothetical protein